MRPRSCKACRQEIAGCRRSGKLRPSCRGLEISEGLEICHAGIDQRRVEGLTARIQKFTKIFLPEHDGPEPGSLPVQKLRRNSRALICGDFGPPVSIATLDPFLV